MLNHSQPPAAPGLQLAPNAHRLRSPVLDSLGWVTHGVSWWLTQDCPKPLPNCSVRDWTSTQLLLPKSRTRHKPNTCSQVSTSSPTLLHSCQNQCQISGGTILDGANVKICENLWNCNVLQNTADVTSADISEQRQDHMRKFDGMTSQNTGERMPNVFPAWGATALLGTWNATSPTGRTPVCHGSFIAVSMLWSTLRMANLQFDSKKEVETSSALSFAMLSCITCV